MKTATITTSTTDRPSQAGPESLRFDRRRALALLGGAAALAAAPASLAAKASTKQRFEFRPVFTDWAPGRVLIEYGGEEVYLGDERIGNELIEWIDTSEGSQISFQLTEEGARRSEEMSRDHLGQAIAVLYAGRVLAAPKVRAVIGRKGVISLDEEALRRIRLQLAEDQGR